MTQNDIEYFLRPNSIAIIGASSNPRKIGYSVVHNVIESGYQGKIYPVNPNATEILGIKAYATISAIHDDIDVAILTVPVGLAIEVAEECGKKGVKGLIVITAGFSEVGRTDLEIELVNKVKPYGTRILGPNVVGVLSNPFKMNASFAAFLPLPGKASLISQSGALLIAIISSTYTRGVGFSQLLPVGNMSDIDFADLIELLDKDETTNCISIYMESLKNGRDFIDKCKRCRKPIVVLKSGISERGAGAAASHTGSLVGVAEIYSAAFEQAGVIQASDVNNLFDRTLALSLQPPMQGDRLAILSNGGGTGVLAADAAEKFGIPAQVFPKDIQTAIRNFIPAYGSAANPIDLTGVGNNQEYYQTTKILLADPRIDGVVVLICEHGQLNPMDAALGVHRAIEESGEKNKPVTVAVIGGEQAKIATDWLIQRDIPTYNAPDLAINAMAALREYARFKEKASDEPAQPTKIDSGVARKIIERVRAQGRGILTEIESKQIFKAYQLPVNDFYLANTEDKAVEAANKLGDPVVMKIVSPAIIHKSDAGGVKLNINSEKSAREAFRKITENALKVTSESEIQGIVVQKMAAQGTEIILGSVNDPTFGPTIMFGLGGIFVEALKDITFQVAPVSEKQAGEMLEKIRGKVLLSGTRGEAPRDLKALVDVICKYAHMVDDLGDEISETDANPCIVYEHGKGLTIVDARIILK